MMLVSWAFYAGIVMAGLRLILIDSQTALLPHASNHLWQTAGGSFDGILTLMHICQPLSYFRQLDVYASRNEHNTPNIYK